MKQIKAVITGITGQDGSYLAELLLEKGYEVHGIIRRTSSPSTSRITHLKEKITIHCGDLLDANCINALVNNIQPDEIYNLAAQSDVRVSFDQPSFTNQVNAEGVLKILEAIKNKCPKAKMYQASTSEMFGGANPPATGYTEDSPFMPRNPYAIAKLYAYWITRNYRDSYGLFTCNGILFNHESARRGVNFVTKKITNWCGKFLRNEKPEPLELGNMNAWRDWGHAKDYIEAMYMILQAPHPDDWLVATGDTHTVREFVEKCFLWMNKPISWSGEGLDEVGKLEGEIVVRINPQYFRPAEVVRLIGNSTKIRNELGWKPRLSFENLIEEMMSVEVTY